MTKVTLIGTKGGPAIRPGSSMPTATLIQMDGRRILVDCGLGVARGVVQAGVALTELDAIVITHLHSDHYLELGPLIHTAWTAGLSRPIPVYGPPGLDAYWAGFLASMEADISLRIADEGRVPLAPLLDIHPIDSGPFSVIPVPHPPVPAWAVRFDGCHSVVISGDCAPHEPLADFARDADLLVHEAMLLSGVDALIARVPNTDERLRQHLLRSHSPAAEVGRIATRAGVRHLALNHLVPADDPEISEADWTAEVRTTYTGPLTIGQDGLTLTLT